MHHNNIKRKRSIVKGGKEAFREDYKAADYITEKASMDFNINDGSTLAS